MTRINKTQSGLNGPMSSDEFAKGFAQIFVAGNREEIDDLAFGLASIHGGATVIGADGIWYAPDRTEMKEPSYVIMVAYSRAIPATADNNLRHMVRQWCKEQNQICALVVLNGNPEFVYGE
jgi:hypothetical protein